MLLLLLLLLEEHQLLLLVVREDRGLLRLRNVASNDSTDQGLRRLLVDILRSPQICWDVLAVFRRTRVVLVLISGSALHDHFKRVRLF